MRLYKILCKKWAIENLKQRRLKISRLDELNDPFELMCPELPTAADRETFRHYKERTAKSIGLLCFSGSWEEPVLWSHYGDKHRGICLGFDVEAAKDEPLVPVTYTATRSQFTGIPAELGEKHAVAWLSKKFESWHYEGEFRVIVRLDRASERAGLHFCEFGPRLQLKQIIVGPLCAVDASLQEALRLYGSEVEILKARLAFRSFEVTKDLRGFWNRQKSV